MDYAIPIAFAVGVLIGSIVTLIIRSIKDRKPRGYLGTLKIDYSTGDPYLFLEMHAPIDVILSRGEVTFDVDHGGITTRG
jgi:hypothetical protein